MKLLFVLFLAVLGFFGLAYLLEKATEIALDWVLGDGG